MQGVKITRLRVRSYRGVEIFDQAIPPAGAVIRGPNASGKTSLLRAIRAALAGRDIGPDAIRVSETGEGEEGAKAEILVDLTAASVRRVITANGSELTVKQNGKTTPSPQKWLTELLGTAPLDPLDFFAKKPPERRAALLAAIPAELKGEDALKIIPPAFLAEFPDVRETIRTGGHALTACASIAKVFFDARTDTNRMLKAHDAEAEKIIAAGPIGADPAGLPLLLEGSRRELADLEGRAKRAATQAEHRDRTTARIGELRTNAKNVLDAKPADLDAVPESGEPEPTAAEKLAAAEAKTEGLREGELRAAEALKEATERVAKMKAALEKALGDRAGAEAYGGRMSASVAANEREKKDLEREIAFAAKERERVADQAKGWLTQADELQASLALTEAAPKDSEIASAKQAVTTFETQTANAAKERARKEAFDRASASAKELRSRTDSLSKLVNHFREILPKRIIGSASGIEGLTIEEDRVLLDGKDVDACSGQEQLEFAVEIARRANAKSRILIVDRLEALDPAHHEAFLRYATRDGYQLLATRVDGGELTFDAIQPAEEGSV